MQKQNIFLLFIAFDSLLITPFALTVPSFFPLTHNFHGNLTAPPPPVCYLITDPPMTDLSSLKCAFLAEDTCSDLASRGPKARDTWIWDEVSGCALGYYLPNGAPVPSRFECEYQIYDQIRMKCATDGRYNAGSANVFDMPDFGGDGSGVDRSMGRYLMAPERLTL